MAREELGSEPRLECLQRRARLEPRGARSPRTKRNETSARFVVVARRSAGLVECISLRYVRGDRGHFVVVVRLYLLRLLERIRLGDGLGAFGQTSALLVGGHGFVGHTHSLAAPAPDPSPAIHASDGLRGSMNGAAAGSAPRSSPSSQRGGPTTGSRRRCRRPSPRSP